MPFASHQYRPRATTNVNHLKPMIKSYIKLFKKTHFNIFQNFTIKLRFILVGLNKFSEYTCRTSLWHQGNLFQTQAMTQIFSDLYAAATLRSMPETGHENPASCIIRFNVNQMPFFQLVGHIVCFSPTNKNLQQCYILGLSGNFRIVRGNTEPCSIEQK